MSAYFHVAKRPHAPRRKWHIVDQPQTAGGYLMGLCGFLPVGAAPVEGDEVPDAGLLCVPCSRIRCGCRASRAAAAPAGDEEPFADL